MTTSYLLRWSIISLIIIYLNAQPEFKLNFTIKDKPQTSPNYHSFLGIPKSPVILNKEKRACVELCLGNSPQCFTVSIQSDSFYLWVVDYKSQQVADRKFDPAKSSTIIKNETKIDLAYDDNYVTVYTAKDDLFIENNKVARIFFAVSINADSFTGYEGMLGLGYTPSSYQEKFSFIEQLYTQKVIYHKVFSQSFTSEGNGELSFGKIPDHIVKDYENYGRCEAVDAIKDNQRFKNNRWECHLSKVYFGDLYIRDDYVPPQNTKVSFFSYRQKALVPRVFFDFLEKDYMRNYINDGTCLRKKAGKYDLFSCVKYIVIAQEINLVFGEWALKIPGFDVFQENKETNEFEMILYHKEGYERWTLGKPIIRRFQMVYDVQNEEIGFYSDQNVVRMNKYTPVYPPKTYSYIPDKEDKKKPNDKHKPHRPIIKPIKPIPGNDNNKMSQNRNKFTAAYVVQILLFIFILLVLFSMVGFCVWVYIRYNRKTRLPSHELIESQAKVMLNDQRGRQ